MNSPLSTFARPATVRRRVLLVDGSPQVLQDLRLLLELRGHVEIVAEAANGQEAVRLAADLAPDGLLMDLEMPVMDGYQATRQIKSLFPTPWVVILSVHAGSEERAKAIATGADAFVVKGAGYDVLAIGGKDNLPTSPKGVEIRSPILGRSL